MRVLYLRPPYRRPVCIADPMLSGDAQGVIPQFWCEGCGKEIFRRGVELCPGCTKEEQENVSKKLPKSL